MFLQEETTLDRAISFYEHQMKTIGTSCHEAQLFVWLSSLRSYHKDFDRLLKQYIIPLSIDYDNSVPVCPNCRNSNGLYNSKGNINYYCGDCGQALWWAETDEDWQEKEENPLKDVQTKPLPTKTEYVGWA